MSAIPPNNLEQLIAWIRLFAEQTNLQLENLKQSFLEIKNSLKKEEK